LYSKRTGQIRCNGDRTTGYLREARRKTASFKCPQINGNFQNKSKGCNIKGKVKSGATIKGDDEHGPVVGKLKSGKMLITTDER